MNIAVPIAIEHTLCIIWSVRIAPWV